MKRRQILGFLTAAGSGIVASCQREPNLRRFSGFAFGTRIGFQVHGISSALFDQVSVSAASLLRELEGLFSLYEPDSVLRRLNREGQLRPAPPEFSELLRKALVFAEKTGGLFDPTVQPLWDFRVKWKAAGLARRAEMEGEEWAVARQLVGFRGVRIEEDRVFFEKAGMAISLNGLVQGYATDRITRLLSEAGVENALVDIGEFSALGTDPGGDPWRLEIQTGDPAPAPRFLSSGRSLAVSSAQGHTFDPEGRFHHLFRPSNDQTSVPPATVVVESPTATEADALATACAVANPAEREEILRKFPKSQLSII